MEFDIKEFEYDVYHMLMDSGCEEVAMHTKIVANTASQIASKYGLNEEPAFIAGILHDIGNIVPQEERVDFCNALAIEVLEEEKLVPALLHSKISKIIAKDIFGVEEDICNAIECHSTLKANPAQLDLILFVADKLSWESKHNKDFIEDMKNGLEISLEHAAYAYLKYMCKSQVAVIHPRTFEALNYLEGICK